MKSSVSEARMPAHLVQYAQWDILRAARLAAVGVDVERRTQARKDRRLGSGGELFNDHESSSDGSVRYVHGRPYSCDSEPQTLSRLNRKGSTPMYISYPGGRARRAVHIEGSRHSYATRTTLLAQVPGLAQQVRDLIIPAASPDSKAAAKRKQAVFVEAGAKKAMISRLRNVRRRPLNSKSLQDHEYTNATQYHGDKS